MGILTDFNLYKAIRLNQPGNLVCNGEQDQFIMTEVIEAFNRVRTFSCLTPSMGVDRGRKTLTDAEGGVRQPLVENKDIIVMCCLGVIIISRW